MLYIDALIILCSYESGLLTAGALLELYIHERNSCPQYNVHSKG
jgi:hypothetical protein